MGRIVGIVLPVVALCILGIAGGLIAQSVKDSSTSRTLAERQSAALTAGTELGGATMAPAALSRPESGQSRNQAAPAHPYFEQSVVASNGTRYAITRDQGVFVSTDGGRSWQARSVGLPRRVVYPFTDDRVQDLTSIGVDPRNSDRVAVTMPYALYLSEDAGKTWTSIALHDPIKTSAYLLSVALSPADPNTIAVGTSFSGIFITPDRGTTWTRDDASIQFLYRGAGFYEEISGLAYSPLDSGVLYLGVGFGGGLYRSTADAKSWTPVDFPGTKGGEVIRDLSFRPAAGAADAQSWQLDVTTDREQWGYAIATNIWTPEAPTPPPPPPSPEKAARLAKAANHAGIYLNARNASGPALLKMIAFLKANGLNSVVVDMKDDFGRLTYDSHLPMAAAAGAIHPLFKLDDLVRVAHENGIYVIGRMVVFKDQMLYNYEDHRYAIWDTKRNAPWGYFVKETEGDKTTYVQKEFWVDPFSEDVWRYNVSIAQELQSRGVDEIQFDYIRFPSEVDYTNGSYRYERAGMSRMDALESFLAMARSEISIPISTDLFGYNCWYPIAGWVGQDVDMLANYVDVVCPMYYPSLFPSDFLNQYAYLDRAKVIYRDGTVRAQEIVGNRALIRPFVQAFLIGGERKMDEPQYSTYLRQQLEGAQQSRSSGFTLWNFGNDYYMVTFPLGPYTTRPDFAPAAGAGAATGAAAATGAPLPAVALH